VYEAFAYGKSNYCSCEELGMDKIVKEEKNMDTL